ncbi:MAG: SMP-30/gluconolactonase/LRE family protein [Aureliella sp.]
MKISVIRVVALGLLFAVQAGAQDADLAEQEAVTAPGAELELVADGYIFTEGPAADENGVVYFTDQPNDRILKCDLDGKVTTWMQPAGRSNGLFFAPDGKLIACADGNNELWAIAPDKSHKVLLKGFEGKRFNGPNDVWVDKNGTLYFTDPFYKRPYWTHKNPKPQLPRQVYRLDVGGKQPVVAAMDFKQPNGIVGDAEKRVVYIADIGDKKTYRFKISENGELIERELFCEMGSDGMTLDGDGNLYLTGKGVTVFSSTGKKIDHIDVPEGWTANVCIGGRERKTLFITASDSLYQIELK